jgi:hypothetical protein
MGLGGGGGQENGQKNDKRNKQQYCLYGVAVILSCRHRTITSGARDSVQRVEDDLRSSRQNILFLRTEVITAVNMSVAIFWAVTQCRWLPMFRRNALPPSSVLYLFLTSN